MKPMPAPPSARRFFGSFLLVAMLFAMGVTAVAGLALQRVGDRAADGVEKEILAGLQEQVEVAVGQQQVTADDQLGLVAHLTQDLRDRMIEILDRPETIPAEEIARYEMTPDGTYVTREVDGGVSMFYSNLFGVDAADIEKAQQLSRLDVHLEDTVELSELVAQAYINTWDTLNRLYPGFDVKATLPPDVDVRTFGFYSLATQEFNPDRDTVWTPVYVDPIQQGWVTSVITPVYRNGFLEGVAGIDITVGALVETVLSAPQPFDGFSLLVDSEGVIIAMPPAAEDLLNLDELTSYGYSDYILQDTFKPADFDIGLRVDTAELARALEAPSGSGRLAIAGVDSLTAWQTLESTGWRVVNITPVDGIGVLTEQRAQLVSATRVSYWVMLVALLLGFGFVTWRITAILRKTGVHLARLDIATTRIADGDFHPVLPRAPMAELERTGAHLLTMGDRLAVAQDQMREDADRLRESEQRYRQIFENVADPLLTVNRNGLIIDSNSAADRLFDEHLEEKMLAEVLPDVRLRGRMRQSVSVELAGKAHILDLSIGRSGEGADERFSISVHDVTAAREAQQLLEVARETAEGTARAKDEFLSSMSHEIRTPMNGVIGILSMLTDEELSDSARQKVDIAHRSANDLLILLNDVLDIAKLEAGQVTPRPVDVDVRAVVEGVVQLHVAMASQQGNSIEIEADDSVPAWLVLDPIRVRQVLMNLLSNAVKFTRNGRIGVVLRVEQRGEQMWLLCDVEDTGVGVSAADQARLFEPFEQADPLSERRYAGTGLGLAIVKRLVELMGGEVGVRSELGSGSTFWFAIPTHEGRPVVDEPRPSVSARSARSLRILVAEDNDVNRLVLSQMLEHLGHQVVEVVNGRDAIDVASREVFDVILMDVQMPVANGVDATLAIRSLPGQAGKIPIIAVTANVLPEQQARYRSAGMNDALPKPITLRQLEEMLARWSAAAGAHEVAPSDVDDQVDEQQATEAPAAPLVDTAAIDQLRGVLGPERMRAMLDLFPRSIAQRREELSAAVAAGDADAGRRVAHTIKGMAGSVGARALQFAAERVQHSSDDDYEQLRLEMEALLPRTLEAFAEL